MILRRLRLEHLERRLLLASDFGDAPAPYDTLLADNGAEHEAAGPRLGATFTSEADGSPSLAADSDSGDDGVTFGEIRVGQSDASVTINVQNAASGAKLDAWIDFNGDGSWLGGDEQIASSLAVVDGENFVRFRLPTEVTLLPTYARFRISTAGDLTPTGTAADGEVEDYLITFDSPRPALGAFPNETAFSPDPFSSFHSIREFATGDLNGDDLADLVVAFESGGILSYQGDGSGGFSAPQLVTTELANDIQLLDYDFDGDLDILSAGLELTFLENSGTGSFTAYELFSQNSQIEAFDIADFDADGDFDFLVALPSNKQVLWLENIAPQQFVSHWVNSSSLDAGSSQHVHFLDLDRDGDLDIAVNREQIGSNRFAWYENDGLGNLSYHEHPTSFGSTGLLDLVPVDLDQDGLVDFITNISNSVYLVHNLGQGEFVSREIYSYFSSLGSYEPSDVDGDGDIDVIVAQSDGGEGLGILHNNGSQVYSLELIEEIVGASGNYLPSQLLSADLDSDGDVDIIRANHNGGDFHRYENAPHGTFASASDSTLQEVGTNSSTVTFSRSGNFTAAEIFQFEVAGTAEYGIDYTVIGAESFTTTTGSIAFVAGEETASLTIVPVADSEVEDHETVILRLFDSSTVSEFSQIPSGLALTISILRDEPVDYGDAPVSYAPLLYNAPAHGPVGPTLGATRDVEPDHQPSPAADADGTDEDGVVFGILRVGQVGATVTVNVQNAPAGARLDAWIDFDGDGTFTGADDRIAASLAIVEGDNMVQFSIPSDTPSGETYARFRLSTQGVFLPWGFSPDGEVEDYLVTLSPPSSTGGAFSNQGVVDEQLLAPRVFEPIDLDRDGDLDFVTAGTSSPLRWIENQGIAGYLTHDITAEDFRILPSAFEYPVLQIADYDGDGDLDIFTVDDFTEYVLFENNGNQVFTARTIAYAYRDTRQLNLVDLDQDGDLDVLALERNDYPRRARIITLENLGDGMFSDRKIIGTLPMSDTVHTEYLITGDFDNDGDVDLVAGSDGTDASPFEHELFWYENHGQLSFAERVVPIPSI